MSLISPCLPSAPQYVSPFLVDSNLTVIWLDWTETFSINGYLKEFTVTESQLRVYTGFYSYLYIPRTSQKSENTHSKDVDKFSIRAEEHKKLLHVTCIRFNHKYT